jgi:hypothetical protein
MDVSFGLRHPIPHTSLIFKSVKTLLCSKGQKGQGTAKGQNGYRLTAHRHSAMNRAIMKAKGNLFGDFVGGNWCWWWQHNERASVRTQP